MGQSRGASNPLNYGTHASSLWEPGCISLKKCTVENPTPGAERLAHGKKRGFISAGVGGEDSGLASRGGGQDEERGLEGSGSEREEERGLEG